jgi:hypothetical protein
MGGRSGDMKGKKESKERKEGATIDRHARLSELPRWGLYRVRTKQL